MLRLNIDEFENIIIYKSLTDSTYLSTIIDAINPKLFKDKHIKQIFNVIKDFYNRRHCVPTPTEVKTYLTSSEDREAFKNVVLRFSTIDKNLNNDELIENTERYIKERAIWETIVELSDDITSGKVDTSLILDKVEKSCNVNLKMNVGLNLSKDFAKVIADINTDQPVIPTGFKWLDERLGGGWARNGRAIYVFAGETNVGKSIFLGNFAARIAKQGFGVLLITLEMSEMVYAKRIASNITKIPIKEFRERTEDLKDSIETFAKEVTDQQLVIKEFPPSTVTPNQLHSYIKNAKSAGVVVDAIVLDYINLLKGPEGDNSYERVKMIAEQIRALSYIFNCPIITATQLGRGGYGDSNPGLATISESIGLAATADFIAFITQTDEERELSVAKASLKKNRFGPNFGSTYLRINYPTLSIEEDESLNDENTLNESSNTLFSLSSG